MVTLDTDELDGMECDSPRAEALLYKHISINKNNFAHLLLHWLSSKDSEFLRHLGVSCWQDSARASIQRFFNNPQAQLCPTKDGIEYIANQLMVLKCLIPWNWSWPKKDNSPIMPTTTTTTTAKSGTMAGISAPAAVAAPPSLITRKPCCAHWQQWHRLQSLCPSWSSRRPWFPSSARNPRPHTWHQHQQLTWWSRAWPGLPRHVTTTTPTGMLHWLDNRPFFDNPFCSR